MISLFGAGIRDHRPASFGFDLEHVPTALLVEERDALDQPGKTFVRP